MSECSDSCCDDDGGGDDFEDATRLLLNESSPQYLQIELLYSFCS